MMRIRHSITALAFASIGLFLASACSTDDESDGTDENGEGGSTTSNPYLNQGGNSVVTPQSGGTTSRGGATGNGGTVSNGGTTSGNGGAATGGTTTGVGGASNTGGLANVAGQTGSIAGNAGDGTAGSTAENGGASAGVAGQETSQAGTGNDSVAGAAGETGNGGTAGDTGAAGASSGGTAGSTSDGTAGTAGVWTAGDCETTNDSLANFCAPENSVTLPNMNLTVGGLTIVSANGSLSLSGNIATAGPYWEGTPFNDAGCTDAGIDATGKAGLTMTVQNNASAPVRIVLYVTDQAGTAAPYSLVDLSAEFEVGVGGNTPQEVNVPFADFVPACTLPSDVSLNYETIRKIGFGFAEAGAVDVTLSNINFYAPSGA